jgi:hypothetical protein
MDRGRSPHLPFLQWGAASLPIPALRRAAPLWQLHRRSGPFWLCGHSMLPLACRFQPHNSRPKSILGKQDRKTLENQVFASRRPVGHCSGSRPLLSSHHLQALSPALVTQTQITATYNLHAAGGAKWELIDWLMASDQHGSGDCHINNM